MKNPSALDTILTALCAAAGLLSVGYGLFLVHDSLPWIFGGVCCLLLAVGPPDAPPAKRGAK